jgi:hypothetical protein
MRRWAFSLLAACSFELRPGTAAHDAASDAAVETTIDAPADAAPPDAPAVFDPASDCPGSYPITLSGQTSRYRIILTGARWWEQSADCANDRAGSTHLVALDTSAELNAVMTRLDATTGLPGGQGCAYVGGVQLRLQAQDTAGWLSITGGALLPIWDPGEPNDGGDNLENSAENFAMLERTRSSLIDIPGPSLFGAVCECDGKPVDDAASAAIIASTP